MPGLLAIAGFAVVWIIIGVWARKRERSVDDYYEREYQDPPTHGWTINGGPGGL